MDHPAVHERVVSQRDPEFLRRLAYAALQLVFARLLLADGELSQSAIPGAKTAFRTLGTDT